MKITRTRDPLATGLANPSAMTSVSMRKNTVPAICAQFRPALCSWRRLALRSRSRRSSPCRTRRHSNRPGIGQRFAGGLHHGAGEQGGGRGGARQRGGDRPVRHREAGRAERAGRGHPVYRCRGARVERLKRHDETGADADFQTFNASSVLVHGYLHVAHSHRAAVIWPRSRMTGKPVGS